MHMLFDSGFWFIMASLAFLGLSWWGVWRCNERRLHRFLEKKSQEYAQAVLDHPGGDEEVFKLLLAKKFLDFRKLE